LVPAHAAESVPEFSEADLEFFEKQVRPLLVQHCYECHSKTSKRLEGGLRLDSRAAVLAGGDTEASVVPGHPEQSLLIEAINYGDLYEMPPKSKLPPEAIKILVDWVQRGLPWPVEASDGSSDLQEFDLEQRKASHWAWQKIGYPTPPEISDPAWPLDPLDHFILAKLEANGLQPASTADPRTLVRRVYFDLIGLPPTPEQVETFASNPTQESLGKVIDQLLATPQFGERWGRHWLDLMRYAESRGHEFDFTIPNAWQYRDYVIRALNVDLPYNQFVTEHLAGDLLEAPRRHPSEGFNESVLATGFWYLGEWVHSPVDIRQDEMDRFDNAIDVLSKAFLGLTVACARCHDHKFDAISQADYYALAGFLQSSAYRQVRFDTSEHNHEVASQLDSLRSETGQQLAALVAKNCQQQLPQLDALLLDAATAIVSGNQTQLESSPWVAELLAARSDSQHPLHTLAQSACGDTPAASTPEDKFALPASSQIVIDYQSEDVLWLTDGPAFGVRPLQRGEVMPSSNTEKPIQEIVQHGRAQLDRSLADLTLTAGTADNPVAKKDWQARAGKILRTPTVELRGGKLFYLLRGGTFVHAVVDSHRTLKGPLHGSMQQEIATSDELRWVEHDLTPYRGHRVHVEFGPRPDSPLQILMVVEGETMPPLPNLDLIPSVAKNSSEALTLEEIAKRCSQSISETIDRLENNHLSDSAPHAVWAQWLVDNPQLWGKSSNEAFIQVLAGYHRHREELLSSLRKESRTAPAIADVETENEFLLVRGNPRTPAKLVSRRLLTAISGTDQAPLVHGSGRLELARRMFDPENPFPARVMANRVWHHLTGRGIVASVDNFGVLGQLPTHPQLLDHLSTRFIEQGWSVKQLIRTIMLSRTYQMSSQVDALAAESDPQNLLYHRMASRRLEAEAIRDTILSLSGQLDSQLFGPSVPVHLTDFMRGRGRPAKSGPLNGDGRRSIYISIRRNFLAPMMLAFDAPQPARPIGRRTISNVPAQALILMNDPFVIEQAGHYARRLLKQDLSLEQRIERLYQETFSRFPREAESIVARQFLSTQAKEYGLDEAAGNIDQQVWTDLCHAMFNVKEFIFIQ